MQNNARVGGILSIVSGAIGIFWMLIYLLFAAFFFTIPFGTLEEGPPDRFFAFFIAMWIGMGSILVVIGVFAIVGGVHALKKKQWGLALAGSIAGTVTFFPTGIPAIIFTSLGKPEFDRPLLPAENGTDQSGI